MSLLQYAESGVEYLIPYAKKKLRELHEYMIYSGVGAFSKRVDADSGSAIYLKSLMVAPGQFIDKIRITGDTSRHEFAYLPDPLLGQPVTYQFDRLIDGTPVAPPFSLWRVITAIGTAGGTYSIPVLSAVPTIFVVSAQYFRLDDTLEVTGSNPSSWDGTYTIDFPITQGLGTFNLPSTFRPNPDTWIGGSVINARPVLSSVFTQKVTFTGAGGVTSVTGTCTPIIDSKGPRAGTITGYIFDRFPVPFSLITDPLPHNDDVLIDGTVHEAVVDGNYVLDWTILTYTSVSSTPDYAGAVAPVTLKQDSDLVIAALKSGVNPYPPLAWRQYINPTRSKKVSVTVFGPVGKGMFASTVNEPHIEVYGRVTYKRTDSSLPVFDAWRDANSTLHSSVVVDVTPPANTGNALVVGPGADEPNHSAAEIAFQKVITDALV